MRNGEAFSVAGGAGGNALETLQELGGNTVRVYDPDRLAVVLDRAQELGLAVVADLPLPAYYPGADYDGLSTPGLQDSVLRTVDRFRDHPALLFWMLGNEVFTAGYDGEYLRRYNALAEAVRQRDPDHPISTGVIPHQLLKLSLSWTRLNVDFLSINIFGNLTNFEQVKTYLSPLWRGPYLISEWGVNGPWEERSTTWGAPIESPSSTKARQLAERYAMGFGGGKDDRQLGNLVFYWGQKYERTPSWFSLLSATGEVSEMAFTLGNLWTGRDLPYPGPRVDYLLLNGQGAAADILLAAGEVATARAVFPESPPDGLSAQWEIRAEDWQGQGEIGQGPEPLPGLLRTHDLTSVTFQAPLPEGPYRLYYQVTDSAGYFATANIPFYVLPAPDAK